MIRMVFYAAMAALPVLAAPAMAQTVLTIEAGGAAIEYDLAALQDLPQMSYATENAFVDGAVTYSGPLLRDVLAVSGLADAEAVTMRALNDYEISFPVSDATRYDVILATRADGALMSVRDKGPVWVMYPVSAHPELDATVYKARMIWQLVEIVSQ